MTHTSILKHFTEGTHTHPQSHTHTHTHHIKEGLYYWDTFVRKDVWMRGSPQTTQNTVWSLVCVCVCVCLQEQEQGTRSALYKNVIIFFLNKLFWWSIISLHFAHHTSRLFDCGFFGVWGWNNDYNFHFIEQTTNRSMDRLINNVVCSCFFPRHSHTFRIHKASCICQTL